MEYWPKMRSEDAPVLWFAMGLVFGAVSALQFAAVVGLQDVSKWVETYQTLVSALTALFAAFIAVLAALWVESRKREDKLRASRAMLPFALSELTDYTTLTVKRLKAVLPEVSGNALELQIVTDAFDPVDLPRGSLEKLQEVIEVAPLSLTTELANLIARFQVFHSRLEEARVKSEIRHSSFVAVETVRRRIVEHLELQARVARLFDFARFLKDDVTRGPITAKELLATARLNKIYDNIELELRIREYADYLKDKKRGALP